MPRHCCGPTLGRFAVFGLDDNCLIILDLEKVDFASDAPSRRDKVEVAWDIGPGGRLSGAGPSPATATIGCAFMLGPTIDGIRRIYEYALYVLEVK